MSKYHIHARKFDGPLGKPNINEMQSSEVDDRKEAEQLGEQLAADGWDVWLYDHAPNTVPNRPGDPTGPSSYRVIRQWKKADTVEWSASDGPTGP